VELYLKQDNLDVFEKTGINERGETVQIVFARSRETLQSTLSIGVDNRGDPRQSTAEQKAFSTENENPFAGFKPHLKQTGIFIDRFFHGSSYEDLAVKYDMSKETAVKTFHNAVRRLGEVIKAMDTGEVPTKQVDYWKKRVEERSGSLPKGQKWYLLNKLFGLRPSEIAELEGLDKKSSSVRQLIIRVSDQLAAGEISLIEIGPDEAEAAKARLERHRARRRGRYFRKKGEH
jgi:DNA-directed RNA polymerase specialized sigma24 family protein